MGLISALVTLPLAPVRGVVWVAEQVAEQAERELYDERRILAAMTELELAHERGELDDERYAELEDALMEDLVAARAHHEGERYG